MKNFIKVLFVYPRKGSWKPTQNNNLISNIKYTMFYEESNAF